MSQQCAACNKAEKWASIKDPRHNGQALATLLAEARPPISSHYDKSNRHVITLTFTDSNHMSEAYQLLIELLVSGQRL